MNTKIRATYTIRELVDVANVPKRRVRFYITEGVLDPPARAGRGAVYTEAHLDRLAAIKQLQADGLSLDSIRRRLNPQATGQLERSAMRTLGVRSARWGRRVPSDLDAFATDVRDRRRRPCGNPDRHYETFVAADDLVDGGWVADAWLRIQVAPGIELHSRGTNSAQVTRLVNAIRREMEKVEEQPHETPAVAPAPKITQSRRPKRRVRADD